MVNPPSTYALLIILLTRFVKTAFLTVWAFFRYSQVALLGQRLTYYASQVNEGQEQDSDQAQQCGRCRHDILEEQQARQFALIGSLEGRIRSLEQPQVSGFVDRRVRARKANGTAGSI
jgi:hypothetical protein